MNKPLVFTFGAAVGAVAALLLSPNSGERNREIVADKVDYYTSHGEQVLQQTADIRAQQSPWRGRHRRQCRCR